MRVRQHGRGFAADVLVLDEARVFSWDEWALPSPAEFGAWLDRQHPLLSWRVAGCGDDEESLRAAGLRPLRLDAWQRQLLARALYGYGVGYAADVSTTTWRGGRL